MEAFLVLEDGRVFKGKALGKVGISQGEVVFNTSMTGYEEILTDPAYRGQLVTLTYPLVGNYGINRDNFESYEPHLSGLIVRESCSSPNHRQAEENLSTFLKKEGITGISSIDTRALTRHIREKGSMNGIISSAGISQEKLLERVDQIKKIKRMLVDEVSIKKITKIAGPGPRIVVMDFGVKYNILRQLIKRGCELVIVPYNTSAERIKEFKADGLLLSSGPGDPRDISRVVKEIRSLIRTMPVFGICLGHQLLGMTFGGKTFKLKFGHHGGNHPVKDLRTGKIVITTQNHGYALSEVLPRELEVTHKNLHDGTVEGIKHRELPVFSLQYHPEAGPGPADSNLVFNEFLEMVNTWPGDKVGVSCAR